jgi:hypothetical protein
MVMEDFSLFAGSASKRLGAAVADYLVSSRGNDADVG